MEGLFHRTQQYSIVSKRAFEIYAQNHDLNVLDECLRIDKETYYGMNMFRYIRSWILTRALEVTTL